MLKIMAPQIIKNINFTFNHPQREGKKRTYALEDMCPIKHV